MDFRISDWISGFQIGFLPIVYEVSFVADPSVQVLSEMSKILLFTFTEFTD